MKWLHDFVSLAGTGNFSRSAEERSVTLSTLSRHIQSLENWLGTELVDRKVHPVKLTDSGVRFLQPAKNIIRQAELMKGEFSISRERQRHTLTFTSGAHLAVSFLPRWLTQIQRRFGRFDVRVQTDVSGIHDNFATLRTRHADFLLHYGHSLGTLVMDENRFEHTLLGRDVLVPVCHHSLSDNNTFSLQRESKEPLPYITPWRTSSVAYLIAEKIMQKDPKARLHTVVESSTVACSKGFVAQGAGIAWLPISAVQNELDSGLFVRVPDASFEIPLAISLYRYTAHSRPLASRFWDYVLQHSR